MKFDHAIILGGGCAGMLAARVVAQSFRRVTIIERATPESRIPQSRHIHVLLKRGQDVFDDLLPGFLREIEEACPIVDWAWNTEWHSHYGLYPRYPSGFTTYLMSRTFLDECMQRRIQAIPNINFVEGHANIAFDKVHMRAIGASVKGPDTDFVLRGDLIVDARGRQSDLKRALTGLGIGFTTQTLASHLSYATRHYQTNKPSHEARQVFVQIRPGLRDRGIIISPIEHGRITVTLVYNIHKPPITDEEFDDAFRQFRDRAPWLSNAWPISPVHVYRNFSGRRHIFRSCKAWPEGLIALGDAACIFNPVYGQGMTVAALEVALLKSFLHKRAFEGKFQRALDDITLAPWLMAAAEEGRAHEQPLFFRMLLSYLDRIGYSAQANPDVHRAFIRTIHMVDPPYFLMKPRIAFRALLSSIT